MGGDGQHQVLGRKVFVAELAHLVLGRAQHLGELGRAAGGLSGGRAAERRQRLERRAERLANRPELDAELAQDRRDDAGVLLEQDGEQVLRRGLGIAALLGQPRLRLGSPPGT